MNSELFYYFSLRDYSRTRIKQSFIVKVDQFSSMFYKSLEYTGVDIEFLLKNKYHVTIKEGYIEGILIDFSKFSKMKDMMYKLAKKKFLSDKTDKIS